MSPEQDFVEEARKIQSQENGRIEDGLQEDGSFIIRVPKEMFEYIKQDYSLLPVVSTSMNIHAYMLRLIAVGDIQALRTKGLVVMIGGLQ